MAADAVDIERPDELTEYLRSSGRIAADESPTIRVLAGGVSNKTVHVRRENGEEWVLKQALPKLRVKVDWFSDPSRIRREAEGLRWLNEAVPGITPRLLFEDPDRYLLAMEAVPQPHANYKQLLMTDRLEDLHFERDAQFFGRLSRIHRRGYELRDDTSRRFADRTFFESLRIEPYYLYTASQEPEAADFLHNLVADTRSRLLTVVHGDFSPKNILVRGDTGDMVLLDHEVIHFGDPSFDVGFALTHLLSKANHRAMDHPGMSCKASSGWNGYRGCVKDMPWVSDLQSFVIRHTLACLLARVSGRSPLEYLTEEQRQKQRLASLAMMETLPRNVSQMCKMFDKMVEPEWD